MHPDISWKQVAATAILLLALMAVAGAATLINQTLEIGTLQNLTRYGIALAYVVLALFNLVFPFQVWVKIGILFVSAAQAITFFVLALDPTSEILRLHVMIGVLVTIGLFIVGMFTVYLDITSQAIIDQGSSE